MFERFDENAIKSVILGQEEALQMGYSEARPDHLLLGLLAEGTGIAAAVLKAQGLNLAATRSRIEGMIGHGSGSERSQVQFTPATMNILELANSLAVQEKKKVATEHILTAFIQAGTDADSDVLPRLGLDLTQMRDDLTQRIEHVREEEQNQKIENDRMNAIKNIVARDTFRLTFLSEIDKLLEYSLSLGDALFMIVNIVGKLMQVSRALIVHIQNEKNDLSYYEYFDVDRVKSIRTLLSTTESVLVAQLLNSAGVGVVQVSGQRETEQPTDPVQVELSEFGVKSQLGAPILTKVATVGCLIVQQCNETREWDEAEVDFFQKVADTIAQGIAQKHHRDH